MKALLKKVWAWCVDEDWIVIAIPALLLFIALIWAEQWFLAILLCAIGAVTLVIEWIAIKITNLSVSDLFRTWKHKDMPKAILILILIGLTVAALIFHFSVNR